MMNLTQMVLQSAFTAMVTSPARGHGLTILDPSMITTGPVLTLAGMVTMGRDTVMGMVLIITTLAPEDLTPPFVSAVAAAAAGPYLLGAE